MNIDDVEIIDPDVEEYVNYINNYNKRKGKKLINVTPDGSLVSSFVDCTKMSVNDAVEAFDTIVKGYDKMNKVC